MQSKLVRILDEGTDTVFAVSKFEESDRELLEKTGWGLSPELTMIIRIGPDVASSMATFHVPQYDIEERSAKLGYNHTTHGLVAMVKEIDFDKIPEVLDVRDFQIE